MIALAKAVVVLLAAAALPPAVIDVWSNTLAEPSCSGCLAHVSLQHDIWKTTGGLPVWDTGGASIVTATEGGESTETNGKCVLSEDKTECEESEEEKCEATEVVVIQSVGELTYVKGAAFGCKKWEDATENDKTLKAVVTQCGLSTFDSFEAHPNSSCSNVLLQSERIVANASCTHCQID